MKYNRVLIIRIDRIGDVVLSTPVIEAARRANPGARIAFMTRPFTKDIVAGNPYLDEVILYDKSRTITFALGLRKKKFDIVLILHPNNRANWIAFLAGIPIRVGYGKKTPWLLTKCVSYLNHQGLKHETEYICDVARAAGIPCDTQDIKPFMAVSKEAEVRIDHFLKSNGITVNYKLAAIHATASCPSKTWPYRRFAELADRLISEKGYKIVIEDVRAADAIQKDMKNKAILLKDSTLQEAAALFKRCRFLVTTDNGLAHIAGALGTPFIIFFGRKQPALGPARWRPVGRD